MLLSHLPFTWYILGVMSTYQLTDEAWKTLQAKFELNTPLVHEKRETSFFLFLFPQVINKTNVEIDKGNVHKWRPTIFDDFRPPSYHVRRFLTYNGQFGGVILNTPTYPKIGRH